MKINREVWPQSHRIDYIYIILIKTETMKVISLRDTNIFLLSNGYNAIDLNDIDVVSVQVQKEDGQIVYPEFVPLDSIVTEYNLPTSLVGDLLNNTLSDTVDDDTFDF